MKTVPVRVKSIRRRMDGTGYTIATDVGAFTLTSVDMKTAGEVAEYILGKQVTVTYDEDYRIIHYSVMKG